MGNGEGMSLKPSFGGTGSPATGKGIGNRDELPHIPQRMASRAQNLLEQAHLKAQVHPLRKGGSDRAAFSHCPV